MRDAYTSIGQTDAVLAFLDPIANRSQYLHFNRSWTRIFLEHDVQPHDQAATLATSLENLRAAGMYGLAYSMPTKAAATVAAPQYECAWRMSDWSIIEADDDDAGTFAACDSNDQPSVRPSPAQLFEAAHYRALKCLQSKDERGTKAALNNARELIIAELRSASLECTNNVYRHLERLALVQQIEDFVPVQFLKATTSDEMTPPRARTTSSSSGGGGSGGTTAGDITTGCIDKWAAQLRKKNESIYSVYF